jgi:imidazolonepropionase-like amidohydrolase
MSRNSGVKTVLRTGAEAATYEHGRRARVRRAGHAARHDSAQALQAGTINGAELLEWQDYVGSITKGKFADIVAVSGDALVDISEMQR